MKSLRDRIRVIVAPNLFLRPGPRFDCHRFPNLKGHLRGKHVDDDSELETTTEERLEGKA